MKTHFILLDYENVQPTDLGLLAGCDVKVYVFVGAKQNKVPFQFAESMQKLGDAAQYVKLAGSGKDALDFHIAYYLGQLVLQEASASFSIVSKDTGFDPLVEHLRETQKVQICRCASIAETPALPARRQRELEELALSSFERLMRNAHALPRTVKTLGNALNAAQKQRLTEPELVLAIQTLKAKGRVAIEDTRVSFPAISEN